jgi:TRAP-type C4-dicarboxylate transport system permease small subunit
MSSIYSSIGLFLASTSFVFAQQTDAATLANPLRVNTITELLAAILNIVIVLAVPVIVFFIIYAGFLYVTAKGNAQQIEQATRSLTYAIIGGVLVLGAVAIAEIIRNLVVTF